MSPPDKEKTAFITHCGFYQYRVMPFGLCNAPLTFQRAIQQILCDYPVFIDDVIVHSQDTDEHLKDMGLLFEVVRSANLKLGLKKCVFQKQIGFLGHTVSKEGIEVDPKKVAAIRLIAPPKTVKQVQSFLGAAGYYERFIKNFSKIAHPLFQLLKKGVDIQWTDDCQTSFVKLKAVLTEAAVLAYPNFNMPFIRCTDASYVTLGAVLKQCQLDDQWPQPVQFASAALTPAQRHYAITELECFAVVRSIQKFKHYLTCMPFKLVTDLSAFNYILHDRGNQLTGRLARWKILLQGMAYEVAYRKGSDNKVPGALSRAPVPPEVEPPYVELVEQFAFPSGVEPDMANLVDWKRAQDDDACAVMMGYLESKRRKRALLSPEFANIIRRTAHFYAVENDVLHRHVITTKVNSAIKPRLCVRWSYQSP